MNFDFTPDNAAEFAKLLSPLVIIAATYIFTQTNWDKVLKSALVFAMAAIVAFLSSYAEGSLADNFWSNLTGVYTLTQIGYWGIMKAAGLERFASPREALATEAGKDLNQQVSELTTEQAKDILNPDTPPALDVTTTVVNKTGDVV